MEYEGSRRGCLAILVFFFAITGAIWLIQPPAQSRQEPDRPMLEVETLAVSRRPYTVQLESYGTIRPKIQSALIAQVSGQIVAVGAGAREGSVFRKGEVLLSIDPRDYEVNVDIAEARLMDARQSLAEAEARSSQARKDWGRLGDGAEAPPLVQRLPQLQAARARVKSAQAELDKARLDVQRTRIVAPYAGRVLTKHVDVGQVVSPGSLLVEIYATEAAEVRLPLRSRDLPYIDLPEPGNGAAPRSEPREATLHSDLSGPSVWNAELVRTEGVIDETARQLHVIAEVRRPFVVTSQARSPLKIGQYVTAEIPGATIADAIVIPAASIHQGSFVYLVEDGLLLRRDVSIAWQNERDAVISSGIENGDALVITPLGQVTSGLRVRIGGGDGQQDLSLDAREASR